MPLIVLSFDGVKDTEFEKMAENSKKYPNIAKFKKDAVYYNNVSTTFVSNTYPIHSCISTGKLPHEHGIISNLQGVTEQGEVWAQDAGMIRSKTIWDAAAQNGLRVASIAWPVTCKANIKYNLPEVHVLKGQNRLIEHLKNGSFGFQFRSFLRHKHKLNGLTEPNLDDFLVSCALDVLKKKNTDLLLLHMLAYDFICHECGLDGNKLEFAKASLDKNLGRILEVTGSDATVLIFSDHGHLNVKENIDLNKIFGKNSFEQCGGSAFALNIDKGKNLESFPWFGRYLRQEEMQESGYSIKSKFGIGAKVGFSFGTGRHKANHGYPKDYPEYNVFYAIKNPKTQHKPIFNDIRNVTAIIAKELNLDMDIQF